MSLTTTEPRPVAALPKTSVEALEKDEELKYAVFSLLASGWSPARISRHFFKTRGVALPVRDIRTFADELPPALFLPPGYLRQKYQELDIQIDAVNILAGIVRMTEDRLAIASLVENVNDGSDKKLSELVTSLSARLFDLTERYVKTLQSLGDFPKAAEPIELRAGPLEQHPTLRDILDKREDGADTAGPGPDPEVPT